jgi:hypothetical protein
MDAYSIRTLKLLAIEGETSASECLEEAAKELAEATEVESEEDVSFRQLCGKLGTDTGGETSDDEKE